MTTAGCHGNNSATEVISYMCRVVITYLATYQALQSSPLMEGVTNSGNIVKN